MNCSRTAKKKVLKLVLSFSLLIFCISAVFDAAAGDSYRLGVGDVLRLPFGGTLSSKPPFRCVPMDI